MNVLHSETAPTEILVDSVICLVEGGQFLSTQMLNILAKAAAVRVMWSGVGCYVRGNTRVGGYRQELHWPGVGWNLAGQMRQQ